MQTMPRIFAVVLTLLLLPALVRASPFSELYVFGDSLSDQGNDSVVTGGAVPPPEYSDGGTVGRFTNGENYVDYFSRLLGLPTTPSLRGGTNYAYGGARTGYRPVTAPFALSLLEQRDAYLADLGAGSADPDALYLVWGGSNDLGDVIVRRFGDPLYDPRADLAAVAANVAEVVASLAAAGAGQVLVPNIPDLGLVPSVTGGGPANPAVSALVADFNLGLGAALSGVEAAFPGLELTRLDAYGLLGEMYRDPVAFGLTNVTDACYSRFVMPGGSTCATPGSYLFWDLEHPTSAAHRVFAERVVRSVVSAPASLGLGVVALALMSTVGARRRGNGGSLPALRFLPAGFPDRAAV